MCSCGDDDEELQVMYAQAEPVRSALFPPPAAADMALLTKHCGPSRIWPLEEETGLEPMQPALPLREFALFLGNIDHATDADLLARLGVRAVLSVCVRQEGLPGTDFFVDGLGVDHLHVAAIDYEGYAIARHFDDCVDFVDRCSRDNKPVLVHCRAGVSRSATIVLAWLMRTQRLSLADAAAHTRRCRPVVSPNFGFVHALMALDADSNQLDNNSTSK